MKISVAFLALVLAAACAPEQPVSEASRSPVTSTLEAKSWRLEPPVAIASPAGDRAGEPFLLPDGKGGLYLSWIERGEESRAAVKMSRFDGSAWSAPVTIVERDDLFVNWADFPSIFLLNDGSIVAHWLQKSGAGTYAYDVMLARSTDGGATWSEPVIAHDDGTESEHGFASFAQAEGDEGFELVWLDGREMTGDGHGHGSGDMTLRWASFNPDLTMRAGRVLDARVCECCQTSMVMTDDGPVVAYRDRSDEEVRDIGFMHRAGTTWSEPAIVHPDGWQISACPVNGPQLDARGRDVAVAWATGAGGDFKVKAAFSTDAGATWSAPVEVDGASPAGRVDLVLLDSSTALVTWLATGEGSATVRTRLVRREGAAGEPLVVGETGSSRSSGFPRTALAGDRVYYAWTQPGDASRILISSVKVGS